MIALWDDDFRGPFLKPLAVAVWKRAADPPEYAAEMTEGEGLAESVRLAMVDWMRERVEAMGRGYLPAALLAYLDPPSTYGGYTRIIDGSPDCYARLAVIGHAAIEALGPERVREIMASVELVERPDATEEREREEWEVDWEERDREDRDEMDRLATRVSRVTSNEEG